MENSDILIREDDFKNSILYDKLNKLFQEYLLSEMSSIAAFKFIKDKICGDNKDCPNLIKWVLMKINNKPFPDVYDKMQLGCPDIVPGLTIKNLWDPSKFPFVDELLKNFDIIKEELINLREQKGFQPYKSPNSYTEFKAQDNLGSYAHDKGQWNVFYLFLHNLKFEDNCIKCPNTVSIIEKIIPRQY